MVVRVSIGARIALGLAVVALIVGAIAATTLEFGGDGTEEREAEAEAIVAQLYEADDLDEVRGSVVEQSIRSGPGTAEQAREILEAILDQPYDVEEVHTFELRDEELVEVRVGQVRWCVREDDQVLVGCRVALTEVEAEVDTPDLTVIFAGVDVIADRLDTVVVVASETGDWIAIEGTPSLETPDELGDGRLVDTALAGGGQQVSTPLEMLRAYPDAGALMAFEVREIGDIEALDGAELVVTWEGVAVDVEVLRVLWLVG